MTADLEWGTVKFTTLSNGLDSYGLISFVPLKPDLQRINIPGVPLTKFRYLSYGQQATDTYSFKGMTFFYSQSDYRTWVNQIYYAQTDYNTIKQTLVFSEPDILNNIETENDAILIDFQVTEPLQNIPARGPINYYCEWTAQFIIGRN